MPFLSFFRPWRESGWESIDKTEYAATWRRYGGSVITHPDVVHALSEIAGIPVRYLGYPGESGIAGALATWGRDLALSRNGLKRHGKKRLFDLGNAEFIFPFAQGKHIPLRFSGNYISPLHAPDVSGLKIQDEALAMVRPLENYSKKFLYNQRRELRLFLESGGLIRDISQFEPEEQAATYSELFARRWGFEVPGKAMLVDVLRAMRPFMMGSVLLHDEQPIAFQLLYHVRSPGWISVEYVNGGVDPAYRDYSPGSILSYINTQSARTMASESGSMLRYSFGRADREYKMRWCHPVSMYRT
ncbi:GNAT family N-acetyltransferase [Azonexus hydrophilus]|uniref:GNAT family N-acetyltransferase n=1 Tax=Azonexus hydrophilus TaxID=418702 RepID=A0A1R1I4C9_9RHOO|nr:GNAT family N-acetyltransferase [Azonexus hydrophilus]OMG53596.1 GNAT family N-acetyltransferase [Azonexus hydrophilus]